MSIDEREEEKNIRQTLQSLPLHPDGTLNISGFHLRDAAHRRLAVEHLPEIFSAVLPDAESTKKRRQIVAAELATAEKEEEEERASSARRASSSSSSSSSSSTPSSHHASDSTSNENQSFSNSSFGAGGGFGSAAASAASAAAFQASGSAGGGSTMLSRRESGSSGSGMLMHHESSEVSAKETIRTRTRTVKLHNVNEHAASLDTAVVQLRPFVSQLLLYPDCADHIRATLGDLFAKFVAASATIDDTSCVVQTFVRWLSALTMRYSATHCLPTCDAILDLRKRAATELKAEGVVHPVEIAQMICWDIVNHLEDESMWYPAARICLCRLYLAQDEEGNAADEDQARTVARMIENDANLSVRKVAMEELTTWLRMSSEETDLIGRAQLCFDAIRSLEEEERNRQEYQQQVDQAEKEEEEKKKQQQQGPENNNNNHQEQQQEHLALSFSAQSSLSFWGQADTLRYACIPLLLAICEKVHHTGRQNNASSLHLLKEATDFALRFAIDPSWRVRYQIAMHVDEFAIFPCSCNNSSKWISAATVLTTDAEPAVRAAIAARATEIFMDSHHHAPVTTTTTTINSSAPSSSSTSSPQQNRDLTNANTLSIMLSLARDPEACVRSAIVKPFFTTWNKLTAEEDKEKKKKAESIAAASSSSSSSSFAPPPSPTSPLRKAQEQECCHVYHSLLCDEDEHVRVIALESLSCLNHLLQHENVLSEAVQAIVSSVDQSTMAPSSIEFDQNNNNNTNNSSTSCSEQQQQQPVGPLGGFSSAPAGFGSFPGDGVNDGNNAGEEDMMNNMNMMMIGGGGETGEGNNNIAALALAAANQASSGDNNNNNNSIIKEEKEKENNKPTKRVFRSFFAGKWQVRKLAATQYPLIAEYMSFDSFIKSEACLWPFLQKLLSDPTFGVREEVIEHALPKIVSHYGATCALKMIKEWIQPLLSETSYAKRRSGFLALFHILNRNEDELLLSTKKNKEEGEQEESEAKEEIKKIAAEIIKQCSQDKVSLVREAVEQKLKMNSIVAELGK